MYVCICLYSRYRVLLQWFILTQHSFFFNLWQTNWRRCSLKLASWSKAKHGVEGFGESGVKGVEVDPFDPWASGGETVEGHSASRPVQMNCYHVGVSGRRYVCWCVIVPGSVTLSRAIQTPRLIVSSNAAVIFTSSPLDSSVCHSDINSPFPLYLPVTVSGKSFATQQLFTAVKSLWMIRIRLLLFHHRHLSVVIGQWEVSVCCVWVQWKLTENWRRKQNIIQQSNMLCMP